VASHGRILLIDVESVSNNVTNIGLASLGALLKSRGHDVRVLDLNNITVPGTRRARLREAVQWRPDVVGVSIFPACEYTYKHALKTLRHARSLHPEALYLIGGVGVTLDPGGALKRMRPHADVAVVNEGEITIAEVVEAHLGGDDVRDITGTAHLDGDQPIINPERAFVKELDSLPFCDYSIFDSISCGPGDVGQRLDEFPIMTSRGCPFNCIFCLNKTLTKRTFRWRSARNVVDEIKEGKDRYRYDAVYIWDDHFSLKPKRAEEICRLLIDEKAGVRYYLPDGIRADTVTPEFARLLKESGCAGVSVGFEDANPETFVHIRKGEKYERIVNAIHVLKAAGVPVRASMVIGLPHTTYESTSVAMKNVEALGIHAEWYLGTPFPGTEFHEWVDRHGRWLDNPLSLRALTFRRVVFDTPEFPRADRYRAFYRAFARYSFPELAFYGKVCNPLTQQRYRLDKYVTSIFTVARYVPELLPSHLGHLARDLVRAVFSRAQRLWKGVFSGARGGQRHGADQGKESA